LILVGDRSSRYQQRHRRERDDAVIRGADDERAGAALRVLAEHARGTQVVLFTHHARIMELAERMISRDGLRVSRLEGSARGT
jgi:hypothetical protein